MKLVDIQVGKSKIFIWLYLILMIFGNISSCGHSTRRIYQQNTDSTLQASHLLFHTA